MKFNCSQCNYTTNYKKSMIGHINRKIKCGAEIAEIIEVNSNIECEYCKITFTLMSNLTRHLKICKIKKEKQESLEKEENLEKTALNKDIDIENKILNETNRKFEELKITNIISRKDEEIRILKEKLQKSEKEKNNYKELFNLSNNKILGNTDIKSVRAQARTKYKKFSLNMICVQCKHSGSTQVCHIKAISEFDKLSLLDEVNHLSNLIGLCPNCHIDLDKHKKFEVSRTATLYTFIIKHLQKYVEIN